MVFNIAKSPVMMWHGTNYPQYYQAGSVANVFNAGENGGEGKIRRRPATSPIILLRVTRSKSSIRFDQYPDMVSVAKQDAQRHPDRRQTHHGQHPAGAPDVKGVICGNEPEALLAR